MSDGASPARAHLPAATGVVAAVLAASCCLLPLAAIATGLAGAGLMMTMMRYEWLTLPVGVGGLGVACLLYVREQRRCDATGCRLAGNRVTRTVLGFAAAVVALALLLKLFPSWTAGILEAL